MPSWIEALKIWNKGKPTWCIPKRDTVEYNEVKKIMNTGKQAKKAEVCECEGEKLCDKPKKTPAPKKETPAKKDDDDDDDDDDEPPVKPKKIEIK